MSMDCKKAQKNLPEYLSGQLAREDRANLQLHLQNCPSCIELMESFAVVDSELQQLPELEPSPWFEQKIMAQVEPLQKLKPAAWWLAWLTPQLAYSLVLLLVVGTGSWMVLHRKPPPEATPSPIPGTEKPMAINQKPAERPAAARTALNPVERIYSSTPQSAHANQGEEIPEEDMALMENIDLLENFDLLAPAQVEDPVSTKPAAPQRR